MKKDFQSVQRAIERQGHSAASAARITAAAGRKELGQKEMTRRSVAGRRAAARRRARKKSDHELAILKRAGAHVPACSCGWEGKRCNTKRFSRMQHRQHVSTSGKPAVKMAKKLLKPCISCGKKTPPINAHICQSCQRGFQGRHLGTMRGQGSSARFKRRVRRRYRRGQKPPGSQHAVTRGTPKVKNAA